MLGELERGKSTLVNALIGHPVLPSGVVPVTTVVTEVHFGEPRDAALVLFEDGTAQETSLEEVARFVRERENPGNKFGVRRVEVHVGTPLGASGVVLVDTPGAGSVSERQTQVAREALSDSDDRSRSARRQRSSSSSAGARWSPRPTGEGPDARTPSDHEHRAGMARQQPLDGTAEAPVRRTLAAVVPHDHEVEAVLLRVLCDRPCRVVCEDDLRGLRPPVLWADQALEPLGEVVAFGRLGTRELLGGLGVRGRADDDQHVDVAVDLLRERDGGPERVLRLLGSVIADKDASESPSA